ncbi:antitoxin VbhA family protein [Hymenobacter canadensis]|uniref:Antitoxin VbhA family protein n=1 Tax=Hymenobacter canadensis TaxID=2999067 RepID=A0ABY7LWT8_9BACT|nr:antitoxin VbhA family protein [Hymenobacter canadensis]WBA44339.1 antitoxin VbhA family protein [Hymenobacter canadensis]
MSNGPAPSPEALAIMQQHVDGEISIEKAIVLSDELQLLARYKPAAGSATSKANPARCW